MGNFSDKIPQSYKYDLAPEKEDIQQADWLTLDKTIFQNFSKILVYGNPPFGEQSNLAIKFFNESAKIADTIAFVLPLSFKKDSI